MGEGKIYGLLCSLGSDRSNSSAAVFNLINLAWPDLAIGTSRVRWSQFTYSHFA